MLDKQQLDNIRIVLVGTSHSGNIGSAARAMKVMGLTNMVLVAPQCEVDEQTLSLASGAGDVALNAQVFESVEQAVADCELVIGTSARSRSLDWPYLESRKCGEVAVASAQKGKVAIVFGRERTGLTNSELQLCQYHLGIPANSEYSSLNLAMAVQIVSYEVRMAYLAQTDSPHVEQNYPQHKELEMFYQHLEDVLMKTQFLSQQPSLIMNKLRRLFTRARPETQELNILRGVLSAISKSIQHKESSLKS